MTGLGEGFAGWWLHAAMGGGLILLLVTGLTRVCRQPSWKQRLSEWGVLAALAVAGLSTMPSWFSIPLLRAEKPSRKILPPAPDNSTQLAGKSGVKEREPERTRESFRPENFADDNDDQYRSALALLQQQGFNFQLMNERGDTLSDGPTRDSVIIEPARQRAESSLETTPHPHSLSPQAGQGVNDSGAAQATWLFAPIFLDPRFI